METTKDIPLHDLVAGVIILKPGSKYFKEDALMYGFSQSKSVYAQLQTLSQWGRPDPICGERGTVFESIVARMRVWGIMLAYTPDYQHSYMVRKDTHEQRLKEEYGEHFFSDIQPLAEKVWSEAANYR